VSLARRFSAWLLPLVLVVGVTEAVVLKASPVVSPAVAANTPAEPDVTEAANRVSAAQYAQKLHHRVEVSSERTESSLTFANPDGSWTNESTTTPVRVERNGVWNAVDMTLVSDATGVHPKMGPDSLTLSAGANSALVSLSDETAQTGISWPSELPTPSLEGATATYSEVSPGVDLSVTATSIGFEVSFVLTRRPDDPSATYTLPLSSSGLTATGPDEAGVITLSDAHGVARAHVSATTMFDAQRDQETGMPTKSVAVTARVVAAGDDQALELSPSPEFLSDPGTVYPVTIDPSVHLGEVNDMWLADNNTGGAGATEIRVGNLSGHLYRGFIKFDESWLTAVPGSTVSSASLALYQWFAPACTAKSSRIYGLSSAFSDSSTWSTQPGGYPTVEATSTAVHGATGCAADWTNYDVTGLVQKWVQPSPQTNYGMLIRESTESDTAGFWRFYGQTAASNVVPSLAVTYNTAPYTPTNPVTNPPTACTTGSGRPFINTTTPQLFVNVSDRDGGLVQGLFTLQTQAGAAVSTQTSAGTPSGNRVFYNVPSGLLSNGSSYRWRAQAGDGALGSPGYTPWCEFTVDTTAPNTPSVSSTDYTSGSWKGSTTSGTFSFSDTSTDVDHYLYSLDNTTVALPTTSSTSTLISAADIGDGWHTLRVIAVDKAGNQSGTPASYSFGAGTGLTSPLEGAKTVASVTLGSRTAPGSTTVTYNYRKADADSWTAIPPADVTNSLVPLTSWPLSFTSVGDSIPPALVWNVASTLSNVDGPVQIQVCFGASCSPTTVHITLDRSAFGDAYATTDFGPGSLSLLTGNLAVSDTDVSVPTPTTTLSVGRTFNTNAPTASGSGMFGAGWTPSLPVDAGNSDWTGLSDIGSSVNLTGSDGSITSFAKTGSTTYKPAGDAADSGLKLTPSGGNANGPTTFTLADLDGNSTVFSVGTNWGAVASVSVPHAFPVTSVSTPGSAQTTTFTYSGALISRILAPEPSTGACVNTTSSANWPAGCRALFFTYTSGEVTKIQLSTNNTGSAVSTVDVACFSYNGSNLLYQAWDPRDGSGTTCGTAVLPTTYTYDGSGRLSTITPAGLAAWTVTYDGQGRASTAARTHSAPFGTGTETSTVKYTDALSGDVSLTPDGTHPEYRPDLRPTATTTWGQSDTPVTAAVVYGPGDNVSATDLRDGTVHYLDVDGREVNTASYSGTGAAGWHIDTTEYNATGATVRSLTARNREEALASTSGAGLALGLPSDTASAAMALSTVNIYATGTDGVADLTDTFGPYHAITLANGTGSAGRAHTAMTYDNGSETGHPTPTTDLLHLVTSSTTGASLSMAAASTNETDQRTTTTEYALSVGDATGWTFGQPMRVIEDPSGLARTKITRYDSATGSVIESRMPSNTAGGGAGTTLSIYYTSGTNAQDSACGTKPAWAGLLCETKPAAQPGVSGLPELVTNRTSTYDYLDRGTQQDEIVKDSAGVTKTRTTATVYTNSGNGSRISTVTETGGLGAAMPTTTNTYDTGTGLLTTVAAASTTENAATSQTTGYDDFGRVVSYNEANEATGAAVNAVTTSYDSAGRVSTVADAHTSRTYTYNAGTEHRGLTTGLAVTVTGSSTFTGSYAATYNADGMATYQSDPNGIATAITVNETGDPVTQLDTKVSDGSLWLLDAIAAPTVHGETLAESGPVGSHAYAYDKLGRLTAANDTPAVGVCTTNTYALDADSNRTSSTAYPAAGDGTCQFSTGGVTTSHTYDSADRTQASGADVGMTYDAFGRTTVSPAVGGNVSVSYYVADLVRSQTQGTLTRSWGLDSAGRFKTWTDSGSGSGSKTNHYNDASSDNPSWIAENSAQTTWTANVTDLLGGLGVTVDQAGTGTMQYANLHGDICATSAVGAASPTLGVDFDEYGNPADGQARRYGWLGGALRSGDALGGFSLMGARLYSPMSGRFLSVDPITGGGANDYSYPVNPVNWYDIRGTDWRQFSSVTYWNTGYRLAWEWDKHTILRWANNFLPSSATISKIWIRYGYQYRYYRWYSGRSATHSLRLIISETIQRKFEYTVKIGWFDVHRSATETPIRVRDYNYYFSD